MTAPALAFDGVAFGYDAAPVLSGIDLTVPAGRLVAIAGPSGCGKSTLIALAAGLLTPDRGQVARTCERLGVVFQDPTLLPWRTALGNVAFALAASGLGRGERRARARAALAEAGLPPADRGKVPRELSGGMRQRVALARALAVDPDLLLCDEPFGALDAGARAGLWQGLRDRQVRRGMTALVVTHDRHEAMTLADLVVVMSMGRIEQVAPPAEIRARPASAFVRDFLAA